MPAAREIVVGALPSRGALAPMLSTLMTRPQRCAPSSGPGEPRQPDGGEHFLIDILTPDLVGDLLERAVARGAGIVDDDVDLAEGLCGLVVDTLDVGGSPTSPCTPTTLPFAPARISFTAASSASRPRAAIATSAPDAAKRVGDGEAEAL